ncbi:hypothetical protein DL96DRAFT_96969 [Flagelloscypha sp. PMI_526]|nr:hypothetical protein DL96DRAFT_96969 [Flagelloscypha sp. PMI_526]
MYTRSISTTCIFPISFFVRARTRSTCLKEMWTACGVNPAPVDGSTQKNKACLCLWTAACSHGDQKYNRKVIVIV